MFICALVHLKKEIRYRGSANRFQFQFISLAKKTKQNKTKNKKTEIHRSDEVTKPKKKP